MKKLFFLILFLGIFIASGSSDLHILYLPTPVPIIKPPERADVQYKRFVDHLGLIESANQWKVVNPIGCMGKYQFAQATLEYLGYEGITPERFKANPDIFPERMQEEVLKELIQQNTKALKKFKAFIGQTINGVVITQAGLIGAAHLAGVGGVQKFLTSNHNPTDCNGSSVQTYLQEFQNYNI